MNISIIGTGHVGLVTGACLAELGNTVICVDNDRKKIEGLKREKMPIYEPGLEELVKRNVKEKRLSFSTSIEEGVNIAEIIFIAVGTPPSETGEADLSYVEAVSREIARTMTTYKVIVEKSTVPVETGEWVERTIRLNNCHSVEFDVVSNPEFLREGSAVYDAMHPDRLVLGVSSQRAEKVMRKLYEPLNAPIIVTDIRTAEIIKHASNAFLATKISFINSVANICERVGAEVLKVAEGMGYDKRIGRAFLDAGIGYGGVCFPKDVAAFIKIAEKCGYDFKLLKATAKVNEQQRENLIKKLRECLWILKGKTIAILGLSFKPDTDDLREAPALTIIHKLRKEGAKIKAYDPVAEEKAKSVIPDLQYCNTAYEAIEGSDAVVIATEWPEFKELDLVKVKSLLKNAVIIDGRNIWDPKTMNSLGFVYRGVGR